MKKVLVIDDEPVSCQFLQLLLKENKYEVVIAKNASAGIKAAGETFPDIIICDVLLPEIDGFEVIKRIQKNPFTRNIPFIFISAFKTELDDIRKAMELGADDYLLKPLKPDEVLKSVEVRLKKFEKISKSQPQSGKKNGKDTHSQKHNEKSKWVLIRGGNIELINTEKIMYLISEADYTKVFTEDGKKHTVSRLLKNWEEILPPHNFLRIHRSTIINLDFVKRIEKWFNNTYRIYILNIPEPLTVSRRYVQKVKSYFLELPN
ncbi:MAG: LytTR family DNA-binding domain-containing protein [Bacteroidota bacterium]|nr:LytTR family DNA-binding domain-containing protein [Bacteroidota bacterium]